MTVYLVIDIASKKLDVAELCDGNYRCKAFENTSAGFLALYNTDIKAFGQRLLLAGKPRMLVVGVVIRKIHTVFGVLKSGTAFS